MKSNCLCGSLTRKAVELISVYFTPEPSSMIFIWQALVFFLGGGHGRHINMEDIWQTYLTSMYIYSYKTHWEKLTFLVYNFYDAKLFNTFNKSNDSKFFSNFDKSKDSKLFSNFDNTKDSKLCHNSDNWNFDKIDNTWLWQLETLTTRNFTFTIYFLNTDIMKFFEKMSSQLLSCSFPCTCTSTIS